MADPSGFQATPVETTSPKSTGFGLALIWPKELCPLGPLLTGKGRSDVFNTDQGVQFTAEAFTRRLESAGVAVSMDGRGRALDNVFVERLWRTVKYEDIYIRGHEGVPELLRGLARYFAFYNHARLHQALGYRTPAAVYAPPVTCDLRLSLPASRG